MSEQTPDTDSGMAEGQDPSMEDILASIRKIIAEDDAQAPSAPEAVIAAPMPELPSPSVDVSELGHVETLDLDIIAEEATGLDPDIESLIGDMDATASDATAPSIMAAESPAAESYDDILDLEIPMDGTEVLAELEAPEIETAAVEAPETTAQIDLVETESLTLEDELIDLVADDEIDLVTDMAEDKPETDLTGGVMAALGLGGAAAVVAADKGEAEVNSEADDLSLMLDNMLEDSKSYEEASRDLPEERVIDPAEDLIAEDVAGDDILSEIDFIDDTPETSEVISESDPDMVLVKSLMADLTETSLDEETELPDNALDSDALLDIDAELEDVAPETIDEAELEAEAESDDILDEILSVTLDDEASLTEEMAPADAGLATSVEETVGESLSLKEIAAAAEADAIASDGGIATGVVAAAAGAAAIGGAAAVTAQDDDPNIEPLASEAIENIEDDVDETLSGLDDLLAGDDTAETAEDLTPESESSASPEPETPEHTIEETPEMPRAKKSEAIIDEVTETATAGAFASLNQAVEEKANAADRGDRIGDLVMEAMQPMLKEWLDANLKGIVERAVTKEVKRISSRK